MWRKQDDKAPVSPVQSTPVAGIPPAPPVSARVQPASDITRITPSVIIKGEVTAREDLFIDGEVQGSIRLTDAEVTIGVNGRVTADIDARAIHVEGKVNGALTARERVRLGRTASVEGEIIAPRLSVEEGAVFRGHVDLTQAAAPAAKPQVARAATASPSATPSASSTGTSTPLLAKGSESPS